MEYRLFWWIIYIILTNGTNKLTVVCTVLAESLLMIDDFRNERIQSITTPRIYLLFWPLGRTEDLQKLNLSCCIASGDFNSFQVVTGVDSKKKSKYVNFFFNESTAIKQKNIGITWCGDCLVNNYVLLVLLTCWPIFSTFIFHEFGFLIHDIVSLSSWKYRWVKAYLTL